MRGEAPLKVAHLLPNLAIGGRERVTVELCRALGRIGVETQIVGYDPLPESAARISSEVPYLQLDRREQGFAAALASVLSDGRCDIAHAQGHIPACYLAQARLPHLSTIATLHVGMARNWRWAWSIRRALAAMDEVTAVSAPMARFYARIAGRAIATTPNGIDLTRFVGFGAPPPRAGEPLRFAMLSRLSPEKRPLDAVRAADRLMALGRRLELHIAGEGPLLEPLRLLAASRPWLHVPGAVSDTAAFLAGQHAFLLPSRAEGMPLALAEAMASGLPAVVSDLPSLRDMAGSAALFTPVGSAICLAEAMDRLMTRPTLRQALSRAARARAEAFGIAAVAQDCRQRYLRLLAERAAAYAA